MATATRTLARRGSADAKRKVDLKAVARATIKEFSEDDCPGLAAESAYHILFSIFPLAIFAASMSAIINRVFGLDLFGKIMNSLTAVLPADARSALAEPLAKVLNNQNGGLLSFGIILALWSGSNALSTFIKALNRAYDVEETRPIWKAKGLQVLLTLFLGALIAVAFVLIVFGGKIIGGVADHIGAGAWFRFAWNLARWPLVFFFITLALAVLYWAGPNVKQRFQWISPGAFFATILWIAAVYGFGTYVSKFGKYDKTYGTLGGMIILLLVFYISSLVIMLGGLLNSQLARRYDQETIEDIADHPEKDKGDTIYADRAPMTLGPNRESDVQGAEARGAQITTRTAPAEKTESGKRHLVNYSTGKREEPSLNLNTRYTMTATHAPADHNGRTRRPASEQPPTKRAAVGVGLLGIGAIGLAAKKILGK